MKTIIINRLREPSTWAGVSIIAAMFGVPPGTVDLVGQVVAGAAGLIAILLPENAAK
jgi:hypothetical protein